MKEARRSKVLRRASVIRASLPNPWSVHRLGDGWPNAREDQAHEEEHEEHEEQYLCDIARRARNASKPEYCGNDGDHQKRKCPTQHDAPLPFLQPGLNCRRQTPPEAASQCTKHLATRLSRQITA